jgi:hypothetical protein
MDSGHGQDAASNPAAMRRLRLRYPGTCAACGTPLAKGAEAFHDPGTKTVRCLACSTQDVGSGDEPMDVSAPDTLPGDTLRRAYLCQVYQAGASVPLDVAPQDFTIGGGQPQAKPPTRRIDRYRLPGWSDLAEAHYLATRAPPRMRGPTLPAAPGIRQSLDGQELSDPSIVGLVARAAGRGSPDVTGLPAALAVPARRRRARGLAAPRGAFPRALLDTVLLGEGRLSKTAIAAHMGIDRKTLNGYIADGLIPQPPWEALAAELTGTVPSPVIPR